ncbi:lysozyme [Pedobacter sp. MC2016-05]|uniref:lysozyme n=1 Tax=Pedobacter sp. MC2016-05 TaxID=2994474 RepID=UPI002245892D|nr:lysozyme [Pedobacter sp. MC2016-05]MCX2474100.1 lysozyme [Pedobacter sp. MC2016-05]
MELNDKGKAFIHNEEGLVLAAYLCPANVWTIGFGNTYHLNNTPVKKGDKITLEQAQDLFNKKIKLYENAVNKGVKISLSQNQFNALTSFCYNIGIYGFLNSTLLKKVNSIAPDAEIETQFNLWKRGGGKVLPVLVARRKREFKLYTTK